MPDYTSVWRRTGTGRKQAESWADTGAPYTGGPLLRIGVPEADEHRLAAAKAIALRRLGASCGIKIRSTIVVFFSDFYGLSADVAEFAKCDKHKGAEDRKVQQWDRSVFHFNHPSQHSCVQLRGLPPAKQVGA
jgi:hypothetical protein